MSLATGKAQFCSRISTSFREENPFLPNHAAWQARFIAVSQVANKRQGSRVVKIPKKDFLNTA
jgi:hypothetical protein